MKKKFSENILDNTFYKREADKVAYDLLGKMLVKKDEEEIVGGMIVETEAYLGPEDPACISYRKRRRVGKNLFGDPGEVFIYMVHGNWLFNILVDKKQVPAAVLIRAIEPRYGLDIIMRRRMVVGIALTNGPGKLTKALDIDKRYNGYNVSDPKSPLNILYYKDISNIQIKRTGRIGVKEDLNTPLRFYIAGNRWVSRK